METLRIDIYTDNCLLVRRYFQQKSITIGRSVGDDIVLTDLKISKHHSVITCQSRRIFLEDLNSKNGTFYKNNYIKGKVELANSEFFVISNYRIELRLLTEDLSTLTFDEQTWKKTSLNEIQPSALKGTFYFGLLIGESPQMQNIYEEIKEVAPNDNNVLITGESGVGKELLAKAIHRSSPRKEAPWLVRNCSAFPEHLIEDELFGHIKGAFSGASQDREGIFQAANKGTLLLDEIGEMPLALQSRLLRVIENKSFTKIGSNKEEQVDVRVICATNKDLQKEILKGGFREDLFYRICVYKLHIPPLRERKQDIPFLACYFIEEYSKNKSLSYQPLISIDALKKLISFDWPGNVRQLQNVVLRSLTSLHEKKILNAEDINLENELPLYDDHFNMKEQIKDSLKNKEKDILHEILSKFNWNIMKAAKQLGITKQAIYFKLKKHNINLKEQRKKDK